MMGSLLSRVLLMVFGYAYPGYRCFKYVENGEPDMNRLLFWCHYWILVAFLTVSERVSDAFISWLPFYSEVKLAAFIYLWHPKTEGAEYIYHSFFRPYLAIHEDLIDRNLLELRDRAGDMVFLVSQRAMNNGWIWFSEFLQYVSAQSLSAGADQEFVNPIDNEAVEGVEHLLRLPTSPPSSEDGQMPLSCQSIGNSSSLLGVDETSQGTGIENAGSTPSQSGDIGKTLHKDDAKQRKFQVAISHLKRQMGSRRN